MIWKPIPEYEGLYEVSSNGKVRTLEREWRSGINYDLVRKVIPKIKSQTKDRYGYWRVTLSKQGKKKRQCVHQLVCKAFHGPPKEGMQVRHLDGDKNNNDYNNLCWGTAKENIEDRTKHGVWVHPMLGKTHSKETKFKISQTLKRRKDEV